VNGTRVEVGCAILEANELLVQRVRDLRKRGCLADRREVKGRDMVVLERVLDQDLPVALVFDRPTGDRAHVRAERIAQAFPHLRAQKIVQWGSITVQRHEDQAAKNLYAHAIEHKFLPLHRLEVFAARNPADDAVPVVFPSVVAAFDARHVPPTLPGQQRVAMHADIVESSHTIALVLHKNRLVKVLEREVIALVRNGVLDADASAPGASRAEVLDELVGAVDEPLPARPLWKALTPARIVHNARVIGSAVALTQREGRDLAAIEADLQAKTERLRREPPQTWALARFAAEELLTARTSDVMSLHIRLSNGATSSYRRLKMLCARHLDDKEGALAAQLVAGIGDLGRRDPAQGLFELASQVAGDTSLQALFDRERDDGRVLDAVRAAAAPAIWRAFAETLAGFLEVHGHRGLAEVDLATRTWRQDPRQVVRLVRAEIAGRGESPRARVARQQTAALSLRARVLASLPFSTRFAVRDAIDRARRYIFLRESTKDLGLRFSAHVREILHALAEKLVTAKQLKAPEDLFHLTRDEVLAVCRGEDGRAIRKLLERRRREQAWCEVVILPKVFDGAVRRIDSGEATTAAEGTLRGITICGGFVEGPARVLHDFHDCETLAAGEIMVAPVTDLAWTPYFLRASGLVVETGGLLSHGSIVAREYGLPAIVGVPDATRRIRTGDRIRLDANRGLVEVVPVGGQMGASPSPR
jgi:phosphohistidine swiveling domain-containing protein